MSYPVDVELPPDTNAPRLARRLLAERFAEELDRSELGHARLLISELVTNAVIHGHGKITCERT